VDILAPGVAIYSSDYAVTNQVTTTSGTSMASPHMAGVAALYLQNNPTATPAQVTAAIKGIAVTGTITLHQKSKKGVRPTCSLLQTTEPSSGSPARRMNNASSRFG
jgi:serine protease